MTDGQVEGEEERQQSSEALGDNVTCSLDLSAYLPDGAVPIGALGIAKFITADGSMAIQGFDPGVNFWEIKGLLHELAEDLDYRIEAGMVGNYEAPTEDDD